MEFFSTLATNHPIFTFFLYIVFCVCIGIGVFFGYSALRKKAEIRKNMKARAKLDKSC